MNKDRYLISNDSSIKDALKSIESNNLGIIFIQKNNQVIGTLTDGDIRRALLKNHSIDSKIIDLINMDYIYLYEKDASRENILKILDNRIKVVPILSEKKEFLTVVSQNNIDWNVNEKMISKARSPLRISFAGGGTDITSYFYDEAGVVLNATINKFTHAILEKNTDNSIKIKSYDLQTELNSSNLSKLEYDGKLDLIISLIKLMKPDYGFNLYTYSDVPPGSGLGGSAVLLSAIIGAFNNFRENKYTDYEIAELAFHAERIVMGLSGGWQDQYATVFGGFNYIEFKDNENIVNSLKINDSIKVELEDSLILCYTGLTHNSGSIHDVQKENMMNKKEKDYADISKNIAYEMKSRLLKGDLNDFGELLNKAWFTKKQFSKDITSNYLDEIYDFAISNGAIGGKLLGAGGGGYFLFYVPTFKKLSLSGALETKGLEIESFTFDDNGLRTWVSKKNNEDR